MNCSIVFDAIYRVVDLGLVIGDSPALIAQYIVRFGGASTAGGIVTGGDTTDLAGILLLPNVDITLIVIRLAGGGGGLVIVSECVSVYFIFFWKLYFFPLSIIHWGVFN